MLIGITGHKFSGKSTVARLLGNATGWEIVSFATPLKKMVCALVGCTMDDLEDYDYKENTEVPEHLWAYCANGKHTIRALMQGLGDLMRKENPNVFIECTLNSKGDYLVSDCRFPNEAKAVKARGGVVCCGDYYVDMQTIIDDIEMDAPKEEFIRWYDYCSDAGILELPRPNFKSWLKGCPRMSEETINRLRNLRDSFVDAIKGERNKLKY